MGKLPKKLCVKVKPLKLEGLMLLKLDDKVEEDERDQKSSTVMVEVKWNGPKSSGLMVPPFYPSSKHQRNCTTQRMLSGEDRESIEWDDEFEKICSFSIISKDGSFGQWDVSFNIIYGDGLQSKTKLVVLGKVSLNLAELASKMESNVERKLPVTLKANGEAREATLSLAVSFAEVRNTNDSPGIIHNSAESDGFLKKIKGLTGYKKKKNMGQEDQPSSCESSEFDSSCPPDNEFSTSTVGENSSSGELSSRTELGSSPNLELDPVHKVGLFSWKRKRSVFRRARRKGEPLIENSNGNNDDVEIDVDCQVSSGLTLDSTTCSVQKTDTTGLSTESKYGEEFCDTTGWVAKELVSRDEQSRLKANVLFASFDQRDDKAAGESACTALVAVIAHCLHSNQESMPTIPEFDTLITEGSSLWRNLCDDETYMHFFPNKHFDLETVLEAKLKPITVTSDKSFTGFFSPEKFESLKGAMSFDEIWNEIESRKSSTDDYEPRIYIVGWNDHFFVLKVEADAYYIIDSLGERLFEGCKQAYILKFDESSLMYGKIAEEEVETQEMAAGEQSGNNEENEVVICSGKECCKEYIKRFLAAIPLRELQVEEKKGTVSTLSLHQRLQIDFHYSSSLTPAISTYINFPSEECT